MSSKMNGDTATEVEVSAIVDTYVYLDEQGVQYDGKTLGEIMGMLPDSVKNAEGSVYSDIERAINQNPDLANLELINQSSLEGISNKEVIACTFKDTNGNIYVSYRGTGDGKWVDNGVALANESSDMQIKSVEYFDKVVNSENLTDYDGKIIITGHSKGGNEAQYVTLSSDNGYLIDNCYSIDGQGFSEKAIENMKKAYGEDYYESQREKMYSINGENDYVHDLGNVVISDDKTFFVRTPEGTDIGGYHNIVCMMTDGKINWFYDEDGNITYGEQGFVGEFAKRLSSEMKCMSDEDFEDSAITIMYALEALMPYDGETGGKYKVGTGDVEKASFEEIVGFFAYGLPMISETLLDTEEGQELLKTYISEAITGIYNSHNGKFKVLVIGFVTALSGATIYRMVSRFFRVVTTVAKVIDFVFDVIDKLQDLAESIKKFCNDMHDMVVEAFNAVKGWLKDHFDEAYKYAKENPYIKLDTQKFRDCATKLEDVNRRLSNIDVRMDSLYSSVGKEGLGDLWDFFRADVSIGKSWTISRIISYINDTAADFESVETKIKNAY